jgi:hypothetical protein
VLVVVGGVGHDDVELQALDEGCALRRIADLAGGQVGAHGTAEAADRQLNLGAQTAARDANGLIFRPPLSPHRMLVARTMVESAIRYSKSSSSDVAAHREE